MKRVTRYGLLIIIAISLAIISVIALIICNFFYNNLTKRIRNNIASLVSCILIFSLVILLVAYLPRKAKNNIPIEGAKAIYYIYFDSDYYITRMPDEELDNSDDSYHYVKLIDDRVDLFFDYVKKITYTPYHFYNYSKIDKIDTSQVFLIQYDNYYILLNSNEIIKCSGDFDLNNLDKCLENSNKKTIRMKNIKGFNYFEMKAMFLY